MIMTGNKGIDINQIAQSVFRSKATPVDNKGTYCILLPSTFFSSHLLDEFTAALRVSNYQPVGWIVCKDESEGLRLCVEIH